MLEIVVENMGRKCFMRANGIRVALGGAGVIILAVLGVTGMKANETDVGKKQPVTMEAVSSEGILMEVELENHLWKGRLDSFEWAQSAENWVAVMAQAVTQASAEVITQPAAEPVIIQPTPQPNAQILVAEAEPIEEEDEETVEVPVVSSVQSPGETQVDTIEVDPQPVPTPTPTPTPTPMPTTDTVTETITQNEQMASIQGGCTIMGRTYTYLDQLVRYYKANQEYPAFYANTDAPTIEAFCQIYIEEAQAEGVRAEVAFCQAMKETGFLRYKGDVSIGQFNFAGIGATGGGEPGNSFGSVRAGIRAQIQHLKAYASTDSLNKDCVDPRFQYVKRGTTPYVEWLGIQENPNGGGWAAAKNYGPSIINDFLAKLFSY